MTKIKATKRSLIGSIMALVFCCSIFMGTTFAWFTSSATSNVNTIRAGKLKVGLVDARDTTKSLVGQTLNFEKASGGANEQILWEPGCTYNLQPFKVVNKGELALKYKLVINGIDGDAKLLEAIGFKVNINGVETDLENYEEVLSAGQPSDKAIVISGHMKEEAGNEYQGLTLSGISIQVVAAQATVEHDSYYNQYDKYAKYDNATTEVKIVAGGTDLNSPVRFENTMAEINSESFEAENVVLNLNGSFSWETGAAHGSTPLVNANNAVVKEVVIDGGSSKDTNFIATGKGVGPIRAANDAVLIFRNLTIVDKSVSYAENSWEFGYLEFGGKLRFENCVFINPIQLGSDAEAEFVNCTFTSDGESMYSVWMHDGSASFTACTFKGFRGLKIHEAYSSNVDSVIVNNCTFGPLSKKPGIAIGAVDSTTVITINNSIFNKCQAGDQGNHKYETDTPVNNFNFTDSNNTVIE